MSCLVNLFGSAGGENTKNPNLPLIENVTTNLMHMKVNLLGASRHLGIFLSLYIPSQCIFSYLKAKGIDFILSK